MTFKWAAMEFPFGGGKSVLAIPRPLDPVARAGLLDRFAGLLNMLGGAYQYLCHALLEGGRLNDALEPCLDGVAVQEEAVGDRMNNPVQRGNLGSVYTYTARLHRAMAEFSPGDRIGVSVHRRGTPLTVFVEAGSRDARSTRIRLDKLHELIGVTDEHGDVELVLPSEGDRNVFFRHENEERPD